MHDQVADLTNQIEMLRARVETSIVILESERKKIDYYQNQIQSCFSKLRAIDKSYRYGDIKNNVTVMKNLLDIGLADKDENFVKHVEELVENILEIIK